ncbi:MAG TPA: oligopeptide/dipeptide ABC transporter ATP-binding protein [Xanthobacteraceae bacterium]|nr:oligopeptide/dipeptide ABC transporter ATP-binding protein [Xanthobacteraceae bacterium]
MTGVTKQYALPRQSLFARSPEISAVRGVDIAIHKGRTFALVGESGCGKSTLAKLLLRLEVPTEGTVEIDGQQLSGLTGAADRRMRSRVQVVMQDPVAAMNPRERVLNYVSEPLRAQRRLTRAEKTELVETLLRQVGLSPETAQLYPHEFSGGQRQRLAIARALSVSPELMVLDEPVSALDVSVRAQILNLLKDLQEARSLTYAFISHDLAIVEFMADEVGVMYLGKIVETGERTQIFENPRHPYTRALLDLARSNETGAVPQSRTLAGAVPSPVDIPRGCGFAGRCTFAVARCNEEQPQLEILDTTHSVACHRHRELAA